MSKEATKTEIARVRKTSELRAPMLSAVAKVVREFQAEPYRFLYESDLQATLFAAMREAIGGQVLVPAPGSKTNPAQEYVVDVVHTEYLKRIDVVCIDPDRASSRGGLKTFGDEDIGLYSLPLFAGIELKYWKMGDKGTVKGCRRDWHKLESIREEYRFPTHLLAIGFVQRHEKFEDFLAGARRSEVPAPEAIELDGIYVVSPLSVVRVEHIT